MTIAIRPRRRLVRLGAILAVTSALGMALVTALTGAPANAATAGMSKESGTVSPAGVIGNGTYRWGNDDGSGLCLAYDPKSRGAARQEGCDNDNTVFWDTVSTSGNDYELIDEHNGQCLSIMGGSGADGAAAFVFTCAGTADQIFTLVPATSTQFPGAYQLRNVNSGKCVSVGGAQTNKGAWVIQWTCAESGEFMWRPFT